MTFFILTLLKFFRTLFNSWFLIAVMNLKMPEFINLNSHVLAKHILAKQHRTFNNLLQVYQKYKSAFGSLDIFYALHRFIPLFFFFLAYQHEHDILRWPNQPRSWNCWHLLLTLFAVGTIKSRIALADVGKNAWSAIFTFRLANCWEKKYQQHKLIRRMMQEINCIFHKRQPLNLTKILFIGDESQKTVTKIFRDYFFLRESTVFYLDDGIFHSKNDVKDNNKNTKCTLPFWHRLPL